MGLLQSKRRNEQKTVSNRLLLREGLSSVRSRMSALDGDLAASVDPVRHRLAEVQERLAVLGIMHYMPLDKDTTEVFQRSREKLLPEKKWHCDRDLLSQLLNELEAVHLRTEPGTLSVWLLERPHSEDDLDTLEAALVSALALYRQLEDATARAAAALHLLDDLRAEEARLMRKMDHADDWVHS